ncbi:MAG TPA: class E sortase, partial [Pilimelia sp.]|nr:class E sortase [Pilimelia sp.]
GTATVPAVAPAAAPQAATSPAAAPPARGVADYRSRNARSTGGFGAFVRAAIRGFGELMITCGLILLLFAAYEIYGKTAIVDAAQSDLDQAFDRAPAAASGTSAVGSGSGGVTSVGKPPPGGAVARLHIPRLAKKWVVVEGVEPDDIKVAPGHYPKSAMPGQVGNFSVAGHRVKSTFWDLDNVVSGDPIVVETRGTWFVYRAAASRIVRPSAVEVVDPVPPGFRSGQRLLTITTCNPKWDNYERLVVHAALERTQPRAAGVPRELRR